MKLEVDKKHWVPVKLGDVVVKKEENDKENAQNRFDRFLKVEHMDAGSLHIKRWSSQEAGDEINPTFYKIFRKGQVLFPTRNPHLKRTCLASFDGICGEKTLTLEAVEDVILPEFLPFLFHSESFYAHTTSSIIGSTNPHCRWRDVASYSFLLPPKKIQERLVELLWSMDEVIEKELTVLDRLNITRESAFRDFVETSHGEFKPLSKLLIQKKGKSSVPHQREKYIGLEHISSGSFTCTDFGDTQNVQAQCQIVGSGDLCYSKLRPYLDKAFIASFDAVSTTELLIYDTKEVSKEFILYHLHSKPFIDYVSGKGFGTKMPRVSHKIIGDYEVKVIANEDEVLGKMQQIMAAKDRVENKIKSSKDLQKALINQVF